MRFGTPARTLGSAAPALLKWMRWTIERRSSEAAGAPGLDEPGLWQVTHSFVSTRVSCAVICAWQVLQVAVATTSRCTTGLPSGAKSSVPAARGNAGFACSTVTRCVRPASKRSSSGLASAPVHGAGQGLACGLVMSVANW